jgi:two-component system NtrC family sensor kinase
LAVFMPTLRLLHVEDDESFSVEVREHLHRAQYDLKYERVTNSAEMRAALGRRAWDLVLCNYSSIGRSAEHVLSILKELRLEIPLIVVSGVVGEESAVAIMRAGAHDCVSKNDLSRLAPAVERALADARNARERKLAQDALRSADKLAILGRMAATLAHEINNPLEAITNILYLLQRHSGVDDQARELVRMAEKEAERVTNLVRQALSFSRHDGKRSRVAVRDIIQNVLDLYRPKIRASKVNVVTQFDAEGRLSAIGGELQQVFANLILNAVDAVGEGGTVKIHVYDSRGWRKQSQHGIRVVIADDGMGIRPEHRNEIFEPFFSTKGDKGTGLGLWICSEIIERHGGYITMRSKTNGGRTGTTFSIFLPAASPRSQHATAI